MDGDIVTTHPSFGIAKFSRHSCSHPQSLFGSSIGHENTITLTISRADHIRSDSSYDRYYEKGQIIEVEMSAAQFAEMITTMNYGSGVPVTLRRIQGVAIEGTDTVNKRQQHSDEFKQRMKDFTDRLKGDQKKLEEMLKKDKLSKEDKRQLKMDFDHLTTEISQNIPFFEQMFEEQMDKTVVESKAEIENFISNTVTHFGLEAIHNQNKLKNGDEEQKTIEIG